MKGKKVLTISIPITKEIFEKDFDFDNVNDPYIKSEIISNLLELERKTGHLKIINDISDPTLSKDDKKLIY